MKYDKSLEQVWKWKESTVILEEKALNLTPMV